MTVIRVKGIGYIDPKLLRWVSELDSRTNMGLPFRAFRFRLEGMVAEFTTTSHTITADPQGLQTFTPTGIPPEGVEEAHMALVRAWESV